MARNHDGNGIRGTGASHCADGPGTAQRSRDVRIGARGPARNFLQFLPNATLKGRGLQVERQLARGRLAFGAAHNFANPKFEVSAITRDLRPGIFGAKLTGQLNAPTAQINGGNSAFGGGDENIPETRFCYGVSDFHSHSSLTVSCGRHAQLRVAAFIDAAGRTEAGFIERVRDVLALAQKVLEMIYAEGCRKCARRETRDLDEGAPQNSRRDAELRGDCFKTQNAFFRG